MPAEEEIRKLEEEIAGTEYNKATQKHIGMLKAKLAKLKTQTEERRSKGKRAGPSYSVKKSGDATALLVGFPSVGKSTLLNKLTDAKSKVVAYDFTTLDVIPGVMEYNKTRIQILDIPGIIEGAAGGKGLGRKVFSVVRNADLIIILLDAMNPEQQMKIILSELYNAGFRLNQRQPEIKISKKKTGGLNIVSSLPLTKMDAETIRNILNEFGIFNADVAVGGDITPDQLIDSLAKNRVYVPAITAINKIDMVGMERLNGICRNMDAAVLISALNDSNLDKLREVIWGKLNFIRVYMKKRGREADMENPVIVKSGSNAEDVCLKIHKDFAKKFKSAKVWGSSKFPGQKVGLDYALKDGDVVELC